MKILPSLFVFSVLFATGDFTECEVCSSPGSTCSGEKEICPPPDDTCAIVSIENSLEDITVQTIAKDCESSDVCMTPGKSMTLGNGRTIQSYSICCLEDACAMEYPQVIEAENSTNGIQCPACFSIDGSCVPKLIDCTGDERHCFEMVSSAKIGGKKVEAIMKGCCTSQICKSIQQKRAYPMRGSGLVFKHGSCPSGSPARSQTTGLLFPTLSGLLLLRIIL